MIDKRGCCNQNLLVIACSVLVVIIMSRENRFSFVRSKKIWKEWKKIEEKKNPFQGLLVQLSQVVHPFAPATILSFLLLLRPSLMFPLTLTPITGSGQ